MLWPHVGCVPPDQLHVSRPSRELVTGMQKMVKQEAEGTRVSMRQARRDTVDRAKEIVSKNDRARAEREVCLSCHLLDEARGAAVRLLWQRSCSHRLPEFTAQVLF